MALNRIFPRIVLRVAIGASLAALNAVGSNAAAQDSGIPLGTKAPNAEVETLDGAPADLGAWLGKEPILMEFWATWCPNCRELEPDLLSLEKQYAGKVRFVSVAVSVNQSPALVKRYVQQHSLRGEQLYDRKGRLTDAYDVPATSYVVAINARGIVVYTGVGGKQDLAGAIAKALR